MLILIKMFARLFGGNKMKQSLVIQNNCIFIDGEQFELPKPFRNTGLNVTQCDGRLYVNGFELVNGKWKHTLAAIWHYIF